MLKLRDDAVVACKLGELPARGAGGVEGDAVAEKARRRFGLSGEDRNEGQMFDDAHDPAARQPSARASPKPAKAASLASPTRPAAKR